MRQLLHEALNFIGATMILYAFVLGLLAILDLDDLVEQGTAPGVWPALFAGALVVFALRERWRRRRR